MWQSKSRLIYSMRWISFILWGGFICRECLNRWMTWNTFTTFTTPGFIQRRNQVTQQLHCSLKGWAAYHNVRCWVISRLLCAARGWNSWKLPASEQMKTWIWIHDCWRLFPLVGLHFPITIEDIIVTLVFLVNYMTSCTNTKLKGWLAIAKLKPLSHFTSLFIFVKCFLKY